MFKAALACCAGSPNGKAQKVDVCAEARECLNQSPVIASVPRMARNKPDYGLTRATPLATEKPTDLGALDDDEPAAGLWSGHSWRQWPSLTDF